MLKPWVILLTILLSAASLARTDDQATCFSFKDRDRPDFDPDNAAVACERLAHQGVAEAALALAEIHSAGLTGDGTRLEEAAKWIAVASDLGNLQAKFQLANIYFDDIGVARDLQRAWQLMEQAARRGHPLAKQDLALFKKAASQGLADRGAEFHAQAMAYARASATPSEVRWIKRSADLGYLPARAHFGIMLLTGRGVPKRPRHAAKYLIEPAQSGDPGSMYAMATILWNGDGVQKDQAQAAALFRRSAATGHRPAMFRAAQLMVSGVYLPRDPDQAYSYWRAIAGEIPLATVAICKHGLRGDFAQLSSNQAMVYCERAAGNDMEEAYLLLGEYLLKSPSTADKGITWLRQAVQKGSTAAALQLAKALLGASDPAKTEEARTLLIQVAAAGTEEAMFILGEQFGLGTFGTGKERDAYFWANLAAAAFPDNRHADDARKLRRRVGEKLDAATRTSATVESLRWLRANQGEKYRVINGL